MSRFMVINYTNVYCFLKHMCLTLLFIIIKHNLGLNNHEKSILHLLLLRILSVQCCSLRFVDAVI